MISMNRPLLRRDLGPATHSPSHLPANTGRAGERHDLSGWPALIWAIAAGTCRLVRRHHRLGHVELEHNVALPPEVATALQEWCSFEKSGVRSSSTPSWRIPASLCGKAAGRLVACPPVCAFTPRTEQNRTRCSSNCWLNLRPGHRLHRSCRPDCSRTS
jgi:hypothetical protein